jgi:hypothetical protein
MIRSGRLLHIWVEGSYSRISSRWLQPLMLVFTRLLDQQPLFSRTLGLV